MSTITRETPTAAAPPPSAVTPAQPALSTRAQTPPPEADADQFVAQGRAGPSAARPPPSRSAPGAPQPETPQAVGLRREAAPKPSPRLTQASALSKTLANAARFAELGYADWGRAVFNPSDVARPLTAASLARLDRADVAVAVEEALRQLRPWGDADLAAARAEVLSGLREGLGQSFFTEAQLNGRGHLVDLLAAVDHPDDDRLRSAWRDLLADLGGSHARRLHQTLGLDPDARLDAATLRQALGRCRPELAERLADLEAARDPRWLQQRLPGAVARLAVTHGVLLTRPQVSPVDRVEFIHKLMFGGLFPNPVNQRLFALVRGNPASARRDTFLGEAVAERLDQAWLWQQLYEAVGMFAVTGVSAGAGDGLLPGDNIDLLVGNGPEPLIDALAGLSGG